MHESCYLSYILFSKFNTYGYLHIHDNFHLKIFADCSYTCKSQEMILIDVV